MKEIVVVLGMHRSGTSAVTRGLHALGVDLGAELMPARIDNPKGFWENPSIQLLNDTLLARLGGSALDLGITGREDLSAQRFPDLFSRGQEIVRRNLENRQRWGFKDPRICRLLPFWQEIFSTLQILPRYLVCVRNPMDVALSLHDRDGLPIESGLLLWLSHMYGVAKGMDSEALVVAYDRLLYEPIAETERMARHVGVDPETRREQLREFAEDFLEAGLRHHASSLDDLRAISGSLHEIPALYERLLRMAAQEHGAVNVRSWRMLSKNVKGLDLISEFLRNMPDSSTRQALASGMLRAKAYVDLGQGFSENDSVECHNLVANPGYSFDLAQFPECRRVRLDPCPDRSVIRLMRTEITRPDGSRMSLEATTSNATFRHGQVFVFDHSDPQVVFTVEGPVQRLDADIELLAFGLAVDSYFPALLVRLFDEERDRNRNLERLAEKSNLTQQTLAHELAKFRDRVLGLTQELKRATQDLEKMTRQGHEEALQLHAACKERDELLARCEELQRDIVSAIKQREELSGQYSNLQREAATTVKERNDLIEQCSELQRQIEVTGDERDKLLMRCSKLQDDLTNTRAMAQKLQDSFTKLQKNLQTAEDQLAFQRIRINELEAELQRVTPYLSIQQPVKSAVSLVGSVKACAERSLRRHLEPALNFWILRKSPHFDRDFYLMSYPDVAETGVDPLRHFVRHGAREGRNPSRNFNTLYYLATYGDVMSAGVNPLTHYVRHGEREGRSTKPQINHAIGQGTRLLKPQSADALSVSLGVFRPSSFEASGTALPKLVTDRSSLAGRLASAMAHERFSIAMSHDNYLAQVGGVQACLADEESALRRLEISYLHLYPHRPLATLAEDQAAFALSINVDGQPFDSLLISDLIKALQHLLKEKRRSCVSVQIHQLLGWSLSAVEGVFNATEPQRRYFWIHDFFSICPEYDLLRNGKEFCHAPDLASNACTICSAGTARRRAAPRFKSFMESNDLTAIAPSEHAKALWTGSNSWWTGEILVRPHCRISTKPVASLPAARLDRPLRIAFLGHPVTRKGWLFWRQLIDESTLADHYEFLHLGSGGNHGAEQFVPVAVSKSERNAMIRALREQEVDITLLWSLWPETFSYTLYESVAAGCFVLTHADSGNISDYVDQHDCGIVLPNQDEFLKLLDDPKALRQKVRNYRTALPGVRALDHSIGGVVPMLEQHELEQTA